jgi:hypothetical protein
MATADHSRPLLRLAWRSLGWFVLIVLWVMASVPFAMWCGMVVDAGWFWLHLGRWPHYNNPDPGSPSLPSVLQTFWPTLIGALAVVTVLSTAGVRKTRTSTAARRVVVAALAFVLLWSTTYLLFRFDPAGIVDWFMD